MKPLKCTSREVREANHGMRALDSYRVPDDDCTLHTRLVSASHHQSSKLSRRDHPSWWLERQTQSTPGDSEPMHRLLASCDFEQTRRLTERSGWQQRNVRSSSRLLLLQHSVANQTAGQRACCCSRNQPVGHGHCGRVGGTPIDKWRNAYVCHESHAAVIRRDRGMWLRRSFSPRRRRCGRFVKMLRRSRSARWR